MKWINFEENEDTQYENLKETAIYLKHEKLDIIDGLLFDEFIILKTFLKKQSSTYFSQQSSNKFCHVFNSCSYIFVYFKFLKIT